VFSSLTLERISVRPSLADDLKTREIPSWLDQWDISPGADWDQGIDLALRESERFLVILSPAAVTSRQVRAEIQAAVDAAKAVFPILHKDCEIPRVIRLYQFLDFRDDHEYSQTMERLVKALGSEKQQFPPPYTPSTARKTRRLTLVATAAVALVGLVLFTSYQNDTHYVAPPVKEPQTNLSQKPLLAEIVGPSTIFVGQRAIYRAEFEGNLAFEWHYTQPVKLTDRNVWVELGYPGQTETLTLRVTAPDGRTFTTSKMITAVAPP
jgi:hypothetical protein